MRGEPEARAVRLEERVALWVGREVPAVRKEGPEGQGVLKEVLGAFVRRLVRFGPIRRSVRGFRSFRV